MAEKIVTEYEVNTKSAVNNLQQVANKLEQTEKDVTKLGATTTNTLNKTAQSASAATAKFNGLSNSVAQIGREIPNFALNAQTGFLAISNNLPILFDNLQRVREENLALAASGQKTTSVFKQVVSSIFSLNTALTLVISLSIIYGKELGNFFASLFKGKAAFDSAKTSLDAINAAYDSKELKNAVRGVLDLSVNIDAARNGFLSKEKVLKQYNDTLGVSFGKVNSLDEAEKALQKNTPAYIDAIIQREAANKIAAQAADTLIELRKAQLKDEKEFITTSLVLSTTQFKDAKDNSEALIEIRKQEKAERQRLAKEAKEAEVKRLQEQFDNQIALAQGFNQKSNEVLKDGASTAQGAFDILTEELNKIEKELLDLSASGAPIPTSLINSYNELSEKVKEAKLNVEALKLGIDRLSTPPEIPIIDAKGIQQNGKDAAKALDELDKKVLDNAQKSISYNKDVSKFYAEQEKDKTEITKEEEERRAQIRKQLRDGAISLASTFEQGLFNLRRANLNAETDYELEQLEKQKENRLITEEQFNQKKSQILNSQAQKQRELDLAQIKVQTALAIIRTFAQLGFPAGIIPAAFAAAEGALQYSFAAAQPLPRFAKGTDRVKGGVKGQDSVHALLMPDEAVIPAKENLSRPNLAKAWISGDLDRFLAMNYIRPAIEANNKAWENSIKINQNSSFIRNDNFNDKRIVNGLEKINRKLNTTTEKVVYKRNRRLWN